MKLHQIDGYIQTIYLVEYPDKLMLLDGCSRADIKTITNFIQQQLNRPLNHLKTVVVTHMHPDHAGAAHKLRSLTGCRIVSSMHKHHWYSGWDGWLMYFTDLGLARWVAKRQGKQTVSLCYWPWLSPDIRLKDGEPVPDFEEWQILETPGHTDRDLSVRHVPSNRIYVADLMVTVKGRYIPPFPVFYPNRYRRSVEKVLALNPDALWLAHAGEVAFSADDQAFLMDAMPRNPITHWRAAKYKLRQIFGLIRNRK